MLSWEALLLEPMLVWGCTDLGSCVRMHAARAMGAKEISKMPLLYLDYGDRCFQHTTAQLMN